MDDDAVHQLQLPDHCAQGLWFRVKRLGLAHPGSSSLPLPTTAPRGATAAGQVGHRGLANGFWCQAVRLAAGQVAGGERSLAGTLPAGKAGQQQGDARPRPPAPANPTHPPTHPPDLVSLSVAARFFLSWKMLSREVEQSCGKV